MRVQQKHTAMAISILLAMLALPGMAGGQQPKSSVLSANGEGTIKLGKEEFKLYAAVVKLFEDGKLEINLVTDITVFMQGTWSGGDDVQKGIDLHITGNVVAGNLEGSGKLFLRDDRKSITSLNLEVLNKGTKKIIKANFTAK